MANDMFAEEALHSMLVKLKPRHRHVLRVMAKIAINGNVHSQNGKTAIQRIVEASDLSASSVSEAINDLEYGKLIFRHSYRSESGRNDYLFEVLAHDLYEHWPIRHLIDADRLWSGRERATVRSEEWLSALRNLGAIA